LHHYIKKIIMHKREFIKLIGSSALAAFLPSESKAQYNVSPKKVLNIAHITDAHIMPLINAAKGFEKCLHHIQNSSEPYDLILNTGDSVMEAHQKSVFLARKQWSLFNDVLKSENTLPTLHCIGNHDICCEGDSHYNFRDGKTMALEQLGLAKQYYAYDTPYWKVIVLDSVQTKPNGEWYTAHIDEEQWDWLENELASANKYVLIASHIPILAACVFFDGNRNDKDNWEIPGAWMHTDARRLNKLFAKYPNVKLAVSGHIHLTDKVEYNDVTYCCNGAVSGRWWKGKNQNTFAGYAKIELFDDGSFKNNYISYS
jgi:3',5'-cyclic-AMP phosphodiesterase